MNRKSGKLGIVIATTALSLVFAMEVSGTTAAREVVNPAAEALTKHEMGNDRVKAQAQTNADRPLLRMAEMADTKSGARSSQVLTASERTPAEQHRNPMHKHWWSGRCKPDDCPKW